VTGHNTVYAFGDPVTESEPADGDSVERDDRPESAPSTA
jgi:hypothetical protein